MFSVITHEVLYVLLASYSTTIDLLTVTPVLTILREPDTGCLGSVRPFTCTSICSVSLFAQIFMIVLYNLSAQHH